MFKQIPLKNIYPTLLLSLCTLLHGSVASAEIKVEIRPVGVSEKTAKTLTERMLQSALVQTRLKDARYHVIQSQFGDRVTLKIYDYTHDKLINVSGLVDRADGVKVDRIQDEKNIGVGLDPAPSPEEFQDAVALLSKDAFFGPGVLAKDLQPYRAMPGVVHANPDPSTWPDEGRVIAVGLLPSGNPGRYHHEMVGVNLSRQTVIRYPAGAPPTSLARDEPCGPVPSGEWTTGQGVPGSADITIRDGNTVLWTLSVDRPSASSGAWGSGVEVRNVYYKGKRVLSRGGVPIFNVKYAGNICGPYRDWSWQEHPYRARGELISDGMMQATDRPSTIFESNDDDGDFRGVTVYSKQGVTYVLSEMEAGWYRYLSEWRFYPDGTIEPRFGFGAVQDSCTCNLHKHHIYWRLDFDIGPTVNNRAEVYDGSRWQLISHETKQYRDGSHQAWRITDPKTGSGYVVIPGPEDQTALGDDYGKGDVWVVHARENETSDYYDYIGTSANIDAFVQGASVDNEDLVVWYGGHFVHDAASDGDGGNERHILGPTLKPVNW